MIDIQLPDGSKRNMAEHCTIADVAASIGPGLARAAVAGKRNGAVVDMTQVLAANDQIEIIVGASDEGLEVIRHSTAHLMAMAIQQIFPRTQITFGPVVEHGFYYDLCPADGVKISSNDFPAIEKKMAELASQDIKVTRKVLSRADAISYFRQLGETFKVEIVQDLPDGAEISIYEMGTWGDLCRGPHVPSTSKLCHFKLMSIAGAYWRANKDNAQLTRIYGTAWASKKDLEAHLHMLEEAKKRDHVLLGKQLDLFALHSDVAVGAPFFLPHGAKLFNLLKAYIRNKTLEFGFQEILTPQIMNVELWKLSGHYDNYRENMYFTKIDDLDYAIKPMSCPAHVKVFSNGIRSYRELPLRYAEFGVVHRHELSGAVHGLTRVRRITQDDGHIFCTMDQVHQEMRGALQLVNQVYSDMGFQEVRFDLSTRPDKRLGSDELWDRAESDLISALQAEGIQYRLNAGDGAFYGPKIDTKVKDAIGRWHQLATIQLDFQTAARLGASYVSSGNKPEVPVMIHRAALGSVERFMGVFIEHTAGHIPVGLAPVQARVINVTESHADYAVQVANELRAQGVRIETDLRSDKLGYKIRDAQLKKTPYMLVIGDKEVEAKCVAPRFHDGTQLDPMSAAEFLQLIKVQSGVFWGLDSHQKG